MTEVADAKPAILVDADACPVKDEIIRVAARYQLKAILVTNGGLRPTAYPNVELIVVGEGADVADNWIVEHVRAADIVVTQDIPLAHRVLQKGAEALTPAGRTFTMASIGAALATRDLLQDLRSAGAITGGPKPFAASDRSRFLQALDQAISRSLRA